MLTSLAPGATKYAVFVHSPNRHRRKQYTGQASSKRIKKCFDCLFDISFHCICYNKKAEGIVVRSYFFSGGRGNLSDNIFTQSLSIFCLHSVLSVWLEHLKFGIHEHKKPLESGYTAIGLTFT
jgi:hypothetical protein